MHSVSKATEDRKHNVPFREIAKVPLGIVRFRQVWIEPNRLEDEIKQLLAVNAVSE